MSEREAKAIDDYIKMFKRYPDREFFDRLNVNIPEGVRAVSEYLSAKMRTPTDLRNEIDKYLARKSK